MTPNFCRKCGAPLEAGAKFCVNCGTSIEMEQSVQTNSQQQFSQPNPAYGQQQPNYMQSQQAPVAQSQNNSVWGWFKRNYLFTEGRINRKAYFFNALKLGGINLLLIALMCVGVVLLDDRSGFLNLLGGLLFLASLVVYLPVIAAGFMLGIRRCHDIGQSGWLMLLMLVPYLGGIAGLLLCLMPGTQGPNRYGPDPLQQSPCWQ